MEQETGFSTALLAIVLRRWGWSKSFVLRANPTSPVEHSACVLNHLQDGMRLALAKTDEVARNGVLQRITSARGFL
jgi:hypothetical protein